REAGRIGIAVFCCSLTLAGTATSAPRVTLRAAVPEQAPPQPVKVELAPALAVSDTLVPCANDAEHVEPQSIPAGLLVTVPDPVPTFVTDNLRPGVCAGEKVAVTG